jgi:hypothetical protein
MILRNRAAALATFSVLAVSALPATAAQASLLSLLPGSCGAQPESQPFASWGDYNEYTPVPGGGFEAGTPAWQLSGGAAVTSGNESYDVGGAADSQSLSLPAGSSATSPYSCTNIFHPTLRLFVENTGAPSSKLTVQALYPGLLGNTQTATVGQLSGSSVWQPSPALTLLASNLLATLSLDTTQIAFRFVPADGSGAWHIDDVYLDPFGRG